VLDCPKMRGAAEPPPVFFASIPTITKGRRVQRGALHPDLAGSRTRILCRSPIADTLEARCRSLALVSGIQFTSHTLRRTFAVTLSEAG